MNTLVSYDWLKQYVKLKETPDEFARRVSLSGPSVEKILALNSELGDKIVVGRVLELKKHPNADKLKLVMVDVGGRNAVPLQIVCGGSNLEQDQLIAVALVGAKVRWHGTGDLVTLEPTEIRGVKSLGMICSSNEIGLGEIFPAEERMILDVGLEMGWVGAHAMRPGRVAHAPTPKMGTPLSDILGLKDDVAMDIEVTSNRPDCMGVVGLAREAAAILNRPFTWKVSSLPKLPASSFQLPVKLCQKTLSALYGSSRRRRQSRAVAVVAQTPSHVSGLASHQQHRRHLQLRHVGARPADAHLRRGQARGRDRSAPGAQQRDDHGARRQRIRPRRFHLAHR